MGTYTTAVKVRSLYPELNTATRLTDTQLDFYVAQAENHISAILAVRYGLPFATTPPLVETITTEYALIKVLDRFYTSETASKNDWRNIRKADLDKMLKSILDGDILLIDANNGVIAQRADIGSVASNTQTYTPTFSHLGDGYQKIDPDRLDDEIAALKP